MKDHITPTLLPIDIRQALELIALMHELRPEEQFAFLRALRADPEASSEPRYDMLLDMPKIIQVARVVG